jgi:predicted ATPase/DNA-binding SARP family transcriptional activator
MKFAILGPIQVWAQQRRVKLGGPQQVALLAFLLLHANRAVSSDALIDALWDGNASGGRNRVQMAIARLRKALEAGVDDAGQRVRTVSGGYLLAVEPGELDADEFRAGVQAGRAALDAGDPASASRLLGDALALWRGPALAEVAFADFAQHDIRQLDELRLGALEARIEAYLQLGKHAEVISELEGLLVEQPARELFAAQLMLALYRCGRQADALGVYQRTRTRLAEELGLEPGPALKALQAQILEQAPSLEEPARVGDAGARTTVAVGARIGVGVPRAVHMRPVGRERELQELSAFLADPDVVLVTLTGTGGTGKTTLALATADDARASFPDGVTVVALAEVSDERQVVHEVARVVGVELSSQDPALDALVRTLRFQRRLVVLDNFEHVLGAAPAVARLAAECPQLKLVVTSRARLRVSGERVYPVGGLAVPQPGEARSVESLLRWSATALFVERARAADPGFAVADADAGSVSELCRYLGGLPLAVELAAARASLLSPTEILERVRRSADSLGPGRRDAPERHRTLQATIDWTLDSLTAGERRLFAVAGLFVGGFTIEAVEAVFPEQDQSVVDGLSTLLDHGLIQRAPARGRSRFAMLEPIRDVALQRLREDSRYNDAASRYAEYYARLAELSDAALRGPGQLECFDQLHDELGNLRAVMGGAASQPQLDTALRIAYALTMYWSISDLQPEMPAWLTWALQQPQGDPAIRTRALFALGVVAFDDREYRQSTAALEECLRSCDELLDTSLTVLCEAILALASSRLADEHRVYPPAGWGRSLAAKTDDLWTQAIVLMLAGISTLNYNDAREDLQRALSLFDSLDDRIFPANVKQNLGHAALKAGDYGYAQLTLEQAAVDADPVWGPGFQAAIDGDLGVLHLLQGRNAQAREYLTRALAAFRAIGWRASVREALTALAALAVIEGMPEHAIKLTTAAQAVFDGPLADTSEILHQRYLNKLPAEIASDRVGLPLNAAQLDTIIRDAIHDDHAALDGAARALRTQEVNASH